jgi:glutamate carboxypeptidase
VNVGLIQGGTRSNVVPAEAAVEVDVRAVTMEEASRAAQAIHALHRNFAAHAWKLEGGSIALQWSAADGTARLFEHARRIGLELGVTIEEGSTGGASDGNFTSASGTDT